MERTVRNSEHNSQPNYPMFLENEKSGQTPEGENLEEGPVWASGLGIMMAALACWVLVL